MPGLEIRLAYLKGGSIDTQPDRAGCSRAFQARDRRYKVPGHLGAGGVLAAIPRFDPCSAPPAATGKGALERLSFAGPRGPAATLTLAVKTYVAKPSTRQRDWVLVDANGKTLGRLATQVANMLRGKRKPEYTPHVDTGDFVVIVNAEKIHVTGDKRHAKMYRHHSGYPGGLRTRTLEEMLQRRPEEVIRIAVKGMLPRNRLARQQLRKLKVYAGPEHPHEAQKPTPVEMEKV